MAQCALTSWSAVARLTTRPACNGGGAATPAHGTIVVASTTSRLIRWPFMNLPAPLGPADDQTRQLPAQGRRDAPFPGGNLPGGPGGPFGVAMGGISAEQKLALLEYWRSVVKRRWAILALGLLVAVVAGIASFALTPVYSTSATVLIEAGRGKIVGIEEVYSISQEREHYQTQVEIVRSRDVAERTARALKLWNRPEFDPRQPKLDWRGQALALLGAGGRFAKTEWTDEALLKSATEQEAAA